MTISDHRKTFAGKRIEDWEPGTALGDPVTTLYRISLSYEDAEAGQNWTDRFAEFLSDPAASQISGLVVGPWDPDMHGEESARMIEALVAAREQLPNLTALFLGDITFEESEISWIQQSDISPIFTAFPQLEHFCARGGNGLALGALHHERLQSLILETGGLDARIVRAVLAAALPALEHLELWLGTANYGATTTLADLDPLFSDASGDLFPRLRYLGLRDSDISDEIASAIAASPLLKRIRVLDLSLGTLGDTGAEALIASPAVAQLEKLDIHHHYCSAAVVARLQALPIEVDASEPEEADEDDGYRYVSVGE